MKVRLDDEKLMAVIAPVLAGYIAYIADSEFGVTFVKTIPEEIADGALVDYVDPPGGETDMRMLKKSGERFARAIGAAKGRNPEFQATYPGITVLEGRVYFQSKIAVKALRN